MRLLVVIPAYNEEECILQTVTELREICPGYDYLVVNDGSRDSTADICRKNGLKLLDLPGNLGLSGGVQAGMRYADMHGYDAVVQFDGDGQHRPEYLTQMLEKISQGYDIVIGSRFVMEKKPVSFRMMGSRLISAAIRLVTGKQVRDPTSGMRMFSKRIVHGFATQININPEPDTIAYLMRCGARLTEVQVSMRERQGGVSYLTPLRSMAYMLEVVLSIVLINWFRKDTLELK